MGGLFGLDWFCIAAIGCLSVCLQQIPQGFGTGFLKTLSLFITLSFGVALYLLSSGHCVWFSYRVVCLKNNVFGLVVEDFGYKEEGWEEW